MEMSRNALFEHVAKELGHRVDGEIRIGGNYASIVAHGDLVYLSGQIPRVDDTVVVTGRVGAETSLVQARLGAKICALRALALLRQFLGDLDRIQKVLRMTVYVRSADDFSQQSEVADAASEVLHAVLSTAGVHTRTSVGVMQLPKNASVEIDLVAVVDRT